MELVKKLREITGAGIMDCKKALEASAGNIDKALSVLRDKGIAQATKREGREAKEGLVGLKVQGQAGALAELNCETDFVARTDDFKNMLETLKEKTLSLGDSVVNDESVINAIRELSGKLGEKVQLRRAARLDAQSGVLGTYLHSNNKIGILVSLNGPRNEVTEQCARDIAMQIAAARSQFISSKDIPAELVEREKQFFLDDVKNKPANIQEKIAQGKLDKWFAEICLLDQVFIKNEDQRVSQYLSEISGKAGSPVTVQRFIRFEVGR
ncbi:MAG TPA: translation elongation factor Ts [Candidatus Omnitrophota bacterium]|nr:translation elongation factor Ts [Candidatus Omnitrophota bacterium]